MEATALICNEQQQFSLETVVLPDLAADQIQIRTQYSGVSIGTEFALIRNKISWGPYPLCTGYMGSGTVEAVGDDVTGFAVGDAVYFRRNDAMSFPDGGAISAVTGAHCSHAILKPNTSHGADHVTPGAGMDVAAMFVMPAVGLNGVDMANPRMGQTVAVHGVGLIGLGVVAALVHRGCRVIAIDVNPRQLALAQELGADEIVNSKIEDLTERFAELAPGGADVVFEATGIPACIDVAIPLCKTLGTFVMQGNYGEAPIAIKFLPAHGRRLNMVFPCDDGLIPCRRAVVRNMAMGALKWEKTITHRVPCADAPAMFDTINKGGDSSVVGVVVDWR